MAKFCFDFLHKLVLVDDSYFEKLKRVKSIFVKIFISILRKYRLKSQRIE